MPGIDWKGLEDEISRVLDHPITLTVEEDKGVFSFQSNDLISLGIFEAVFARSYAHGYLKESDFYQNDKGDLLYAVHVNLRWEHIRGGSDGTDLLTAWYETDTKKWSFRGIGSS